MTVVLVRAASPTISDELGSPDRSGRLELRRERILAEAECLFLARGFARASVNEIVRHAGGSLTTLYKEFGSKEGLFSEVLSRRVSSVFASRPFERSRMGNVKEVLVDIATDLLDRLLRNDGLALYRIAVSEGERFPALRKVILDQGHSRLVTRLSEILVRLGVASGNDRLDVAAEFLSLVYGQLVFRAACGGAITQKERVRHVQRAVVAFLMLRSS